MNKKNLIINGFLTITSIYIPLFFYSFYDYLINKGTATSIEKKRIIQEDIPQKIEALKAGYIPRVLPRNLFKKEKEIGIYPIGSLPNTKTYLCNEGYGLITYKSDRFGLRNYDQKWKIANKKSNIFVLGGSFLHGMCVPEEATITSNIEKKTKINTINLGSGGNGPYQNIAILRSMVKPILDKSNMQQIVLIIFYPANNEAYNARDEKLLNLSNPIIDFSIKEGITPVDSYTKEINSFIRNNFLEEKDKIILKLKSWKNNDFRESTFYNLLTLYPARRDIGRKFMKVSNFKIKENEKENEKENKPDPSRESMMVLSEICKNRCQPIIAYIPNSNFWNPDSRASEYKIYLQNMAMRMNIGFIDGEKVISRNNRSDYSPSSGHLSIDGYKKFSDLISDFIKSSN